MIRLVCADVPKEKRTIFHSWCEILYNFPAQMENSLEPIRTWSSTLKDFSLVGSDHANSDSLDSPKRSLLLIFVFLFSPTHVLVVLYCRRRIREKHVCSSAIDVLWTAAFSFGAVASAHESLVPWELSNPPVGCKSWGAPMAAWVPPPTPQLKGVESPLTQQW